MPAIVSNKLRLYNARNFVESFDVESLPGPPSTGIYPTVDSKYSNTSVYFFIGRTHSWASNPDAKSGYSDSNPPPVALSFSNMEFEPWRSMTSAKKITSSDVSLMTNRTNWTSGVIYDFYDDQSEAVVNQTTSNGYFVYVGTSGDVFLCLDNNDGAISVDVPVKPDSGFRANSFVTSDGYRWRYMYSISPTISDKFLMTNYIPVRSLTQTELQKSTAPTGWDSLIEPQRDALPGSLETIIIEPGKGGSLYRGVTKTLADGGFNTARTEFELSSATTYSIGELTGTMARFSNSSFSAVRRIKSGPTLDLGTNFIVDSAVTGLETTGGAITVTIGPEVIIEGDGTGAIAYAELSTGGTSLKRVAIDTPGSGYSDVTATVNSVPAGSGAQIRAIIPPQGGYGSDPVRDLGGYYGGIAVTLDGRGRANNLPLGSAQYRQLGLMRNPTINTGSYVANGVAYRQMTKLTMNLSSGGTYITYTPARGDTIAGLTSGARAIVVDYDQDYAAGASYNKALRVVNLTTNSTGGGFIGVTQGPASEIIAKVDAAGTPSTSADEKLQISEDVEISQPELLKNSGEIFYVENRRPITRSVDQQEDFKIIIEF